MDFEWHEAKRLANIERHGFDFIDAAELFEGKHLMAPARTGAGGEQRWLATGIVQGLYATAIYTVRDGVIRIISLRRARDEERRQHQAVFGR